MRVTIRVEGIVQGVGFRPFIYRIAVENRLHGYVRNTGDAGVEIVLEGDQRSVHSFLKDLKEKKPPLAQIYGETIAEIGGPDRYGKFTIRRSSGKTELSGSVIPADIATCDDCLRELRNTHDPRHEYFFITCTNCGPRFTMIERLPYDRENTTMRDFPMCPYCQSEYKDPLNRRFHAETIACPVCGPRVYLTDANGTRLERADPVREAGKLLSEGWIVAVKGYGGFHVGASAVEDKPLARLREVKHRSQKPFAIMSRTLESTITFAEVNETEEKLLTSPNRPIVLLNKSKSYYLSDLISPALHNVGVMLPYTGLHHMLFDRVHDAAFVMTSANPPNQPIIKDNDEALRTLGTTVDYFLFHNREIAYRCDDSVLRTHGAKQVYLRRSRGYAPTPVTLKENAGQCVLALGGELNNTACLLNGDKAFLSQHIGDAENVETLTFLEAAAKHMIRLTNSKVEAVSCDLHPKFNTTSLAERLAQENGWRLVQVQHHYAHLAGLMMEHSVQEMVGICCDGFGYGLDGEAWGGEILLCMENVFGFKRLAHLQEQPLVGGDMATRYPVRMVAGILHSVTDIQSWLMQNRQHLLHGEKEVELIIQQLEKTGVARTTSCGRILDAVSAVLGLCFERTYEGEPSMKLESAAMQGKDILKLEPMVKSDTLNTTEMLLRIFEEREKYSKRDLAFSAHAYLGKGLASLSIKNALEYGVKNVGFSGGVACNSIITAIIRRAVEAEGLRFHVHESVPAGDGGLSFGQAVASAFFHD